MTTRRAVLLGTIVGVFAGAIDLRKVPARSQPQRVMAHPLSKAESDAIMKTAGFHPPGWKPTCACYWSGESTDGH